MPPPGGRTSCARTVVPSVWAQSSRRALDVRGVVIAPGYPGLGTRSRSPRRGPLATQLGRPSTMLLPLPPQSASFQLPASAKFSRCSDLVAVGVGHLVPLRGDRVRVGYVRCSRSSPARPAGRARARQPVVPVLVADHSLRRASLPVPYDGAHPQVTVGLGFQVVDHMRGRRACEGLVGVHERLAGTELGSRSRPRQATASHSQPMESWSVASASTVSPVGTAGSGRSVIPVTCEDQPLA